MGWIVSLAAIGVLVLAVIGLGPAVFANGVYAGFQTILQNPTIAAAVSQLQNYVTQQLGSAIHLQ